jgi:hypothetical protein
MIVSLDCYFTRKRAAYHFYRNFLDVFIFLKLLREVFATLYVNYIKIRLQNTLIMFAVLLKQYPINPRFIL